MDRVTFRKDDVFSIVGTGVIGILFIQLIKLSGGRVVAIDLDDKRLSLAKEMRAEHT
ncbi:unnamed protein product, partial [marine sediment metagenome]